MRFAVTIVYIFLTVTIALGAGPLFQAYKQSTKGSPYKALRILKPYIPELYEKPLYYFTLGLAYKKTKNFQKAVDYLRRAYITAKDRDLKQRALFLRGQAYEEAGFFYEAKAAYGTFMRLYPKSPLIKTVKVAYARACLSIGDLVEAMKAFRGSDEEQIDVIVGKAEIFHKTGFYETAQELYQKAIEKNWQYFRDHPERLYWLAENLRMLGQKERARRLYYFLLDSPMRQWAFLSLALIDISEEKGHDAVLHLRMALQEPPNRARVNPWQRRELLRKVYLTLGRAYLLEDKTLKAKRVLLKLRQDFPGTPEAEEGLIVLGSIYTNEDKFIEATAFLREVLYGRSHKKEALEQLKETILRAMDKDKKAFLSVWKMAGTFLYDESFARELISIGGRLKELGSLDAIKVYKFVLDSAEENARKEALNQLAELFIDTRSKEGLKFVVARMKKIKVGRDVYKRTLAWLRAIEGKNDRAYKLFKDIKTYKRTDLDLLRLIAEGASDYEEFVHIYKKIASEVKGPPDYGLLAWYAMMRKRPKEALKYYRLYIKAMPEARVPRAMVLLLSSRPKDFSVLINGNDVWASLADTLKKVSQAMERLRRL
jgi:tetratricopeptide (TPR) repeat protein